MSRLKEELEGKEQKLFDEFYSKLLEIPHDRFSETGLSYVARALYGDMKNKWIKHEAFCRTHIYDFGEHKSESHIEKIHAKKEIDGLIQDLTVEGDIANLKEIVIVDQYNMYISAIPIEMCERNGNVLSVKLPFYFPPKYKNVLIGKNIIFLETKNDQDAIYEIRYNRTDINLPQNIMYLSRRWMEAKSIEPGESLISLRNMIMIPKFYSLVELTDPRCIIRSAGLLFPLKSEKQNNLYIYTIPLPSSVAGLYRLEFTIKYDNKEKLQIFYEGENIYKDACPLAIYA